MGGRDGGRAYDEFARARWVPEPAKRAGRSDFERDRARVLHSSSLRRLAAKTQVVLPWTDDFVRNRLTHSLEVAQVGRELGRSLGCDPDVVDTACLAHDLGHPPFGHNGETALNEAAKGIGGFEGNAQTLRLLTRLESKTFHPDGRSAGLNLTRASLDAATKYPWRQHSGSAKFGVYDADLDAFGWLRRGVPESRRCVEAQVMDWADDVAYSVHDVEDGIVAGKIDLALLFSRESRADIFAMARSLYLADAEIDELAEALDRLMGLPPWPENHDGSRRALARLKDLTSQLIGRFCRSVEQATHAAYGGGPLARYAADLVLPRATVMEVSVLKATAALLVMHVDERMAVMADQRQMLADLVRLLSDRAPTGMSSAFAGDWLTAKDDDARLRVVIDQVASLTDGSASALHAALIG